MKKILYLVHDLSDPAVFKRVNMLKDGGAEISIAGFRRVEEPIYNLAGCKTINLGQTYNAGFLQRLLSVVREIIFLKKYQSVFSDNDIIIARNLEMLAIGVRVKKIFNGKQILVYESLDIHRLLLNKGIIGKIFRKLEGHLTKKASALITSSPAFISEYFDRISEVKLPTILIENKVYNPALVNNISDTINIPKKPWKIGWFGAIRCRKSLDILTQLVKQSNGNIEVIIRGRPSLDQFDDFYKSTSSISGLKFLGEYKNPDDLAAIYSEVHFTWAIDMFEEGLNSSWLLPNRIYEGCLYGSVPVAISNVETGRFINNLKIGAKILDVNSEFLVNFFSALTEEKYREMKIAVQNISKERWIYSTNDCRNFVTQLSSLNNS